MTDIQVESLVTLVGGVVVIALVVWAVVAIIRAGVRRGMRDAAEEQRPREMTSDERRGFEVRVAALSTAPAVAAKANGRAVRYRVDGVDRETKLEATAYISASTEANARAKAELDGLVVTAITIDAGEAARA